MNNMESPERHLSQKELDELSNQPSNYEWGQDLIHKEGDSLNRAAVKSKAENRKARNERRHEKKKELEKNISSINITNSGIKISGLEKLSRNLQKAAVDAKLGSQPEKE